MSEPEVVVPSIPSIDDVSPEIIAMGAIPAFPCPKCHVGTVIPQASDGRFFYHHNVMINLHRSILLPRCMSCKEDFMTESMRQKLDNEILPASYKFHEDMIKASYERLKRRRGTN